MNLTRQTGTPGVSWNEQTGFASKLVSGSPEHHGAHERLLELAVELESYFEPYGKRYRDAADCSKAHAAARHRQGARANGSAHLHAHTHEGCPSCALEQLDALESVGVDLRRVCIGHIAMIKPGAEPIGQTAKTLAKRGAFVGFDTVGHAMRMSAIPEADKVKHVLAVIEAGFAAQLLLSGDSTPVPQMKTNWGNGYATVPMQFAPKLRYAGVKDTTLHQILVDNPRRFLAFVPKPTA